MAEDLDISKKLNWKRIVIPVVLGLGAAIYLLVSSLKHIKQIVMKLC